MDMREQGMEEYCVVAKKKNKSKACTNGAGTIEVLCGTRLLRSGQKESDGASKEKRCQTAEDKRDFVTFAMFIVKLSVAHRPKVGECVKSNKEEQEPMTLGKPDSSISIRTEGTTVQPCGNSKVAERWITGHYAMVTKYEDKIGYPVGLIDDHVKHISREHKQEADHLANLGAKGQRKITVEKGDNTENWKEVRRFLDGTKKTDGKIGVWSCTGTSGSQSAKLQYL